LELQGSDAVEKFKNIVRKSVYDAIDGDLSNSDFKTVLENRTKDGIQKMQANLSDNFQKEIESFQKNVADIIKKFERYASELLNVRNSAKRIDTNFELKINLKSGINWFGLLSSVAGSVIGVLFAIGTGPVGWVVIALSIIGGLISIGKAVIGFFNKDFKKSEQKKSTDKSLAGIESKLRESIQDNFQEPFQQLDTGVKSIKDELQKSISHVEGLNKILVSAQEDFAELSENIEREGAK
jgi:peptidoglycan hydrolase CwlO-like protein